MKYLATGDLHLTERSRLGPEWLGKQQNVWQQIITLAVEHDVDALLFAGDAFEHRHPTPAEIKAFVDPLQLLHCPVIAIAGNHDVVSADYPTALECILPNVARTPTVIDGVACLPWTPLGRLAAERKVGTDRSSLTGEASELLVRAAADLRSEADVLMLHWSVSNFSLPNGLPVEELREVVLDFDALTNGWKHVVMGHIHRAARNGPAFYVGSPMCLNFGETGVDHGCWIVQGNGHRFIPLDYPRFVTLEPGDEPPDDPEIIVRVREEHVKREIARAPELNDSVTEYEAVRMYCEAEELDAGPVIAATDVYLETEWVGR